MNSIRKGKRHELAFSRLLSEATSAVWHRVPQSGAGATNKAQAIEDKRFLGDLFSDDPRFADLVVECKCRKAPVTLNDVGNPKSDLTDWIKQTMKESGNHFWLLMFTWNRAPTYLVCPPRDDITYPDDKGVIHQVLLNRFVYIADIGIEGFRFSLYREKHGN